MKELKFKEKLKNIVKVSNIKKDSSLNCYKNQSKLIPLYSPLEISRNLWEDRRETIRFSPLKVSYKS